MVTTIALVMTIVSSACIGSAPDSQPAELSSATTARQVAPPSVAMATIRGDHTQDISIHSPVDAENLPVVYLLHGLANDRHDMDGFANALAREGLVVFVPDIRTNATETSATDVECGYDYAMANAAEFGGDVDRPVTLVGWSFGAVTAFFSGLDEEATGLRALAEGCVLDAARPDVIVSIAGCHTTWDGDTAPIDPAGMGWDNTEASIVLISGELDAACDPSESVDAVAPFEAAGYEVSYTEIADAHHGAMVFFPPEEHGTIEQPTGRAGERTVQLVVDAINNAADSRLAILERASSGR
jgi:dienelactone hydrolase